jgi:hypothetical protein
MADGVNIADATRSFTDREWNALSSENRRHVHEEQERRRPQNDSDEEPAVAVAVAGDVEESKNDWDLLDTGPSPQQHSKCHPIVGLVSSKYFQEAEESLPRSRDKSTKPPQLLHHCTL